MVINEDVQEFSLIHELIYELRVKDAMTRKLITATEDTSLREIQRAMRENRISGVLIVENKDELRGIVSIEDIINALDKGYIEESAGNWMTQEVITIQDEASLVKALHDLDKYRFGRLPVVDSDGKLVGIITRSDITRRLMLELNKYAERIAERESQLLDNEGKREDETTTVIEAEIKAGDFQNAGRVAAQIKKELQRRNVSAKISRRAAIAAYEAETNIILHTIGGKMSAEISNDKIVIKAMDWGPGIEDIDLAMKEGYSTANAMIRALGFGAGMGLPNIKKCADEFDIQSEPDLGTRLTISINLKTEGANEDQ